MKDVNHAFMLGIVAGTAASAVAFLTNNIVVLCTSLTVALFLPIRNFNNVLSWKMFSSKKKTGHKKKQTEYYEIEMNVYECACMYHDQQQHKLLQFTQLHFICKSILFTSFPMKIDIHAQKVEERVCVFVLGEVK